MAEGIPTDPCPWWLEVVDPERVRAPSAYGEAVFRCQPPLPSPVPPGFAVTLTRDNQSFALRLFPVPGNPRGLLGVSQGLSAYLCAPFLEEVVNTIAHDLRNLIFTVSLQAEIAQRQGGANPHLATILAQVAKVQRYLERLLLYGRAPHLSLTTVNVESFIQEILRAVRVRWPAAEAPLTFRLTVEGEAGVARWDPQLLASALEAVLDNAARANPPQEAVDVLLLGKTEEVTLEIRDHGPGIPPETLAKLFVPMACRRPHGMGLGLPTAKKLVEAHGGTLELATSPQGTVVRFVLPREPGLA
ncbi:MAG: sensor histidine kinase [Thermoanaerobaculum sp.]